MQLIPGGGELLLPFVGPTKAAKKGAEKVAEEVFPVPNIPTPTIPPPPPTKEDPAIVEAKQRQRQIELRRRGRRASILTSGRGVEAELGTVNRPQARATQLLGE